MSHTLKTLWMNSSGMMKKVQNMFSKMAQSAFT